MSALQPLAPLDTRDLFAPLHAELMTLLRGLTPADWGRPTVAGSWRVRDVAAHLLDGMLRKLSLQRDGHSLAPAPEDGPIDGYPALVGLINRLNAGGVEYGRRLSPRLLVDLLEIAGRWVAEFTASLDPQAPAVFSVLWAEESASLNWLDTGREYTEHWHHQMQIRDAVAAAPTLLADRWLAPLLDFSVRALPPSYAATSAPLGTAVTLVVPAERPLAWSLVREGEEWRLYRGQAGKSAVVVTAPPPVAWRLFYNAPYAAEDLEVTGDRELARPLLRARSVMV